MKEREEFIKSFRAVQPKFSRLCAAYLIRTGLTLSQYTLLAVAADAGTLPMTEVSEKLRISKPAVTNLVDRLEESRLLKRMPHLQDRRIHLIQIQPKGREVVRKMQGMILGVLLQTLNEFRDPEKQTIQRFYARLSRTLDESWGQHTGKKK